MSAAAEAISQSRLLRQEAASAIDHTHRMQEAAHEAVNETLIRKIAQTVTLTVSTIRFLASRTRGPPGRLVQNLAIIPLVKETVTSVLILCSTSHMFELELHS